MDFDLIISHLNEHNEISLMLCKEMGINKIIMVCPPNSKKEFNAIKELYRKYLPKCMVIEKIIGEGDCTRLIELLNENKNNKVLINLNNDCDINSFILLNEAYKYNMKCIYIDLYKMKRYVFEKDVQVILEPLEDISISLLAEFSGNDINHDENDIANKEDTIKLAQMICKNLSLWRVHKKKLFDKSIMIHDRFDNQNLVINTSSFNEEELELSRKILNYLREMHEITYKINKDKIEVLFQNDYLKSFIFKIGTWLEVLTNSVIREIKEIDEVKTSVEFYWSKKDKKIKNELDVLAIKDCIMFCISCKDSNKYDEEALNELDVYSERIGGEDAVKILVATDYPTKTSVIDRAKEMDINLVIVNENIEEFKNKLKRIVAKNNR